MLSNFGNRLYNMGIICSMSAGKSLPIKPTRSGSFLWNNSMMTFSVFSPHSDWFVQLFWFISCQFCELNMNLFSEKTISWDIQIINIKILDSILILKNISNFSHLQMLIFVWKWKSLSCVWLFVTPCGLYSPWNSLGQNTGLVLQGIFPTQGSNSGLPHCRLILYHLSHKGSPRILEWVAYPFSRGSSWPRNWTRVSCIAGEFLTNWAMIFVYFFPIFFSCLA